MRQGEVVYHWSGHQEEDIADMHELSVTAGGDNGYFFTSQGSDPYFTLPKITADANFNYSLKVTITAPEATSLKIFFPIAKHQFEYREEESFSGQLKTGENTFYVPLNGNELQGKIRIDLGKAQGKYLFKSLEIRAIKPVKSTHAE